MFAFIRPRLVIVLLNVASICCQAQQAPSDEITAEMQASIAAASAERAFR